MRESSEIWWGPIALLKKITENNLITRMLAYSAMKISANLPLLYSVLNPDTSSDSPSARSNGVRLVSAKEEINQAKNTGVRHSKAHEDLQ